MTAARVRQRSRTANYPPLASVGILLLIVLAILPSALNLPQSNPTQTLEYAPVPPRDASDSVPNTGNLASLGLAGNSSLTASAPPTTLPPDSGGPGGSAAVAGSRRPPSTKRCVGTPPRQTADPTAPPCVGYFDGDNFGATYQGVTAEEVRVIIMVTGFSTNGNYKGGNETTPEKKYYDLALPPQDSDHSTLRYLRAWQQYFNDRYQTYNRYVHFWAYFPGPSTPEERRADAADNYAKVRPFAVVWPHTVPNISAYNEVAAQRGVATFVGTFGLRAGVFGRFPKLSWGYLPSLEEHAATFISYACEKVAPNPVSFSGNSGENGQTRKYGLIYSAAVAQPEAKAFVDLVKPEIKKCGIEFADERTHPFSFATYDGRTTPQYAAEAMSAFQQEGITTIIWMMGYETNFSKSAAAINYRPEWILAGDGFSEGLWGGQYQEQTVWDHAVVMTVMARTKFGGVSQSCEDAYTEVDPTLPHETLDYALTCSFYNGIKQLFIGIQVAGPRLGPTSMDKGYHAIPAIPSSDPSVAACYYGPGDYTCVKDATVFWYDSTYSDANTGNTEGCWRLMGDGQRYLRRGWPDGNVDAQKRDTDPCNGFLGGLTLAAR